MELELSHLRVVCRLADTGSVSKAAAALGVSQPSLTAQLHRIEEAIGGPLFERGPHGVVGDSAGQARAGPVPGDAGRHGRTGRQQPPLHAGSGTLRLGSSRTVCTGPGCRGSRGRSRGGRSPLRSDSSCAVLTDLLAADILDVVMIGRCEDAYAPPCPTGVREQTMVYPEPFAVALPADHRLADATRCARGPGRRHLDLPAGRQGGRRPRLPARGLRGGRLHAAVPVREPRHRRDRAADRRRPRHQPVRADGPRDPPARSSARSPASHFTGAGPCAGAPTTRPRRTSTSSTRPSSTPTAKPSPRTPPPAPGGPPPRSPPQGPRPREQQLKVSPGSVATAAACHRCYTGRRCRQSWTPSERPPTHNPSRQTPASTCPAIVRGFCCAAVRRSLDPPTSW